MIGRYYFWQKCTVIFKRNDKNITLKLKVDLKFGTK